MAIWIELRDGELTNMFSSRKEAVKHFKKLLNQTLKDFDKQDRNNEFDYAIKIPEIEYKPIERRDASLSLL